MADTLPSISTQEPSSVVTRDCEALFQTYYNQLICQQVRLTSESGNRMGGCIYTQKMYSIRHQT